MLNKKILSMLGLARRAGRVDSGEFAAEKAVKSGKAWIVLVAEDASDNTKKMFLDMCGYYEVPCYVLGQKEELGHAIGQQMRASLAVTDENFSGSIQKLIEAEHRERGGCENGERDEQ